MSSFVENLSILTLFLSVEGFKNFSANNFTTVTHLKVEHNGYIYTGCIQFDTEFCLIPQDTRKRMTSGIFHIQI